MRMRVLIERMQIDEVRLGKDYEAKTGVPSKYAMRVVGAVAGAMDAADELRKSHSILVNALLEVSSRASKKDKRYAEEMKSKAKSLASSLTHINSFENDIKDMKVWEGSW